MPSTNPKVLIIPIVVVVAIVGVLALAAYFSTEESENRTVDVSDKLVYDDILAEPINDQDWVKGVIEEPRLTIVVYSDFQCPACAYAHEKILNRLVAEHPDDLRLIFRHFPISSSRVARRAAQATEAAGVQGKFWEMADLIYQNQQNLTLESLDEFATQLELDLESFEADLESEKYKELVAEDKDSGDRSGVNATPTFYINGEKYEGKISYNALAEEVTKRLP